MDGSEYLRTGIDGKQMLVHRVEAEAFHGPKLLFHVDHINRERDDNRACNLEWVTPYENNRRARSVKRSTSGKKWLGFSAYPLCALAHSLY